MPDRIRQKTNKKRTQTQKKNHRLFWALTIKSDGTNRFICELPLLTGNISSHGSSVHQMPFKKNRTDYRFDVVIMNAENNSK
jgi:hypothetical protein